MTTHKDKRNLLLTSHNFDHFFTKYATNTAIQDSMISLIDNLCYNASIFLDSFSRQQLSTDTSILLQHFNTFTEQNHAFRTEIKQDLSLFTTKVTEDINSQIGTLVLSINSIVDLAVAKINPNHITEQLKLYIQQSASENSSNTIAQLEQHIKSLVIDPINSIQSKFYDNFSKLIDSNTHTQPIIEQFNLSSKQWMSHLENIIVSIKTLEVSVDSNDIHKVILDDVTYELDKHIAILNTSITQINHNTRDVSYIKSIVDSLVTKVERIRDDNSIHNTKSIKTAKVKGNIAEDKLFVLLQEQLPARDHFTVSKVSGSPHSTDILVSRTDFPNIRIESKDYTDTYVSYPQLEKFKRDLIERNNHGIFVSMSAKIANKGDIDIEQLINGKFAIYLSGNHYDIDFIITLIYFIYKIDSIFSSFSDTHIVISPDTILLIKDFILDTREKFTTIKERLRLCLNDINNIDMDRLENILLNQLKHNDSYESNFTCNQCDFTAKNKRGLNIHKAKCSTKTLDIF